MRLRAATPADAGAIAAIYAPYVTASVTSFETEAPGEAEMRARIEAGGDAYPWLVAEEGGALLGYAYAAAFRARPAYRFVVETSVYLAPGAQGRGIGRTLYEALIDILTRQGFVHAIGAITVPNPASVRLHERLGFTATGLYRRVGYKLGGWHDVGLWQKTLAEPSDPPREPLKLSELPEGQRP